MLLTVSLVYENKLFFILVFFSFVGNALQKNFKSVLTNSK
jgi:hypothetical protein